jgi:multidrug efflux pump subunit AcrA (membrane-fusion protein)
MDIARPAQRAPLRRYLTVAAVVGAIVLALIVMRLKPAVPTVAMSSLVIDTVQRGTMRREVRGPGALVPAHVRLVTTTVAARVDRIVTRPGTTVHADTVLVELSNEDLKLQTLEAERQAAAARAELTNLEAASDNQRYAQESAIVSIETNLGEAQHRAEADSKLAKRGFLSDLELGHSQASVHEQSDKLAAERRRLDAMARGRTGQIAAQRAQVGRLDAIAQFRREQLAELRVRAGVEGTLQDLSLDAGQWVTAGTVLAKITEPGGLKAEIRVPEVLAKDVSVRQPARVDTRNGLIDGHVSRVYPGVVAATVKVEIELDAPAPASVRADQNVEASIEVEVISDAIFVGRPAIGEAGSEAQLFRLSPAGDAAEKVAVRLGRASARTIEVLSGLSPGDRVVLSTPALAWSSANQIRLQ